jgi:hypothetical protein
MTDYLSRQDEFGMLSIADLLKARDEFHLHLVHKANVVGTAIGRYRIRKDEPWPGKGGEKGSSPAKGVRTLGNSEVRYYSWPAILVFVREWLDDHHFGANGIAKPEDFVPPAVYMSDGRKAPICVIKAELDDMRRAWEANYTFPTNLVGGGYPLLVDVQGQEHVASVGCLVSDGHKTYALTNRHVAGEPGTPVYTIMGGNKVQVGVSSPKSVSRLPFTSIYDGWAGKNVYVDLDAALVELTEVGRWTTQIYGIGPIGKLADLATDNLSLRLLGCPVRAFGAASREMFGEIAALFYRFKSVGGFDYVSDFLIGPRGPATSLGTHPGDSGTVWLIEVEQGKPPLPLAVQWGGQVFVDGADSAGSSFALATSLSNVCDRLEVDLIRDWNADQPDYWGAVGHYGIANKAIGKLPDGHLRTLMEANLDRITFEIGDVTKKGTGGLSKQDFVPLADVPDLVWKIGAHRRGGPKAPEHANHFADMDRKLKKPLPEGATLLSICDKPAKLDVGIWQRYYDAVKKEHPDLEESRGLLPFRAWQIFDAMVYYVQQGDAERFVCAAGILSHYVGDACQPLHISYLFNGDPDRAKAGKVRDRSTGQMVDGMISYGAGCHGAYEDNMIDSHVSELWPGVDEAIKKLPGGKIPADGKAAGWEVVTLMKATFGKISPMDIVEKFEASRGEKPKDIAQALWDEFGDDTIDVIAAGSDCLARLWRGAWTAGGGDKRIKSLGAIPEETLAAIYQPFGFLQSETLDSIEPVLATGNGGADGSANHDKTGTPRQRRSPSTRG